MHSSILRYFIAVVRAGSIRKASEELHIATSALSRQIKKLEDELGTVLFERLSNGLRLTTAGEAVFKHANETLHEFDLLRSDLGALKGKMTGRVHIACLDSLVMHFLPEEIKKIHQVHPEVKFRVQTAGHGNITNLVANGDADFGVTFDLARPDDTKMIHSVPMPLVACVGRGHPLSKLSEVSLDDCAQYDLLLQLDTQPIRSLIEIELSIFERTGKAFITCNSQMMAKPFIMSGDGVAFFTPLGFLPEIMSGDIIAVPLTGSRLQSLRMGIIVQRRRQLTMAAEAIIGTMAEALERYSEQMKVLV